MRSIATIDELREVLGAARAGGQRVGFVPTMGALHEGHRALMARARGECDTVVTSIFVNPLQFAADEDLDAYPRDLARDGEASAAEGVDILFVPSPEEMYPEPILTTVTVADIATAMEGASRPTHFAGVATVVAKLFSIVGPCRAYFGEKDYQQLMILRRMARDLSMPVEVLGHPTVRAPDGLALSSRNAYLTPPERSIAPVLYRSLSRGAQRIIDGDDSRGSVLAAMSEMLADEASVSIDYLEIADADTLRPVTVCGRGSRLFGAIRIGRTRLIDNVGVDHG